MTNINKNENSSTNHSICDRIKTLQDALSLDFHEHTQDISRQIVAFTRLATLAHVLNEGKNCDDDGYRYYVFYNVNGFSILVDIENESIKNPIWFANHYLAQHSIEIAKQEWLYYYDISE